MLKGKNNFEEVEEDDDPFDPSRVEMDDEGNLIVLKPTISGKIKLTFNADKPTKQEMEVDADAYMAELRGQVGHASPVTPASGLFSCSWSDSHHIHSEVCVQ